MNSVEPWIERRLVSRKLKCVIKHGFECAFPKLNGIEALCHYAEGAVDGIETPLHKAAFDGDDKVVNMLIKDGAGLDKLDKHGITPLTVKKNVEDVLAGLYKGDTDQSRITAKIDNPLAGGNLATVLDGLRTDMRKAAENLEFEEAARLRDEVKRLEAVDLAIADDPMARQYAVDKAVNDAKKSSGRSTLGRGGMRGGVKRRGR